MADEDWLTEKTVHAIDVDGNPIDVHIGLVARLPGKAFPVLRIDDGKTVIFLGSSAIDLGIALQQTLQDAYNRAEGKGK